MNPDNFFTPQEEQQIVNAIRQAEKNTSGEIRVHLESKNKDKPTLDYVWQVFEAIGMRETKQANGVLFYIDINHRTFSIVADEGINKVVPDNFWGAISKIVTDGFKQGQYANALEQGILKVGEQLKQYFPHKADDVNELPDEISKH